MDGTAVKAISELATKSASLDLINTDLPIGTINGQIVDLEKYQLERYRFRGNYKTTQIAAFVAFALATLPTIEPGQASGFVDPESMTARVFFNLGTEANPGHADWTANLTLKKTAAYESLGKFTNAKLTQKMLIEWIEDWSHLLDARFANDESRSMTKAIAAIREITIRSEGETKRVENQFDVKASALESVTATGAGDLPIHLEFKTEPYAGFEERTFLLRLSVITSEKDPILVLRIVGKEDVEEAISQEFAGLLNDGTGDKLAFNIGTFTA
jgi:uncharacterized protein YfdQ (DUF2303 family)